VASAAANRRSSAGSSGKSTAERDMLTAITICAPAAFYLYSPDRKAERAHALLKGCRGHLHADAYPGFAGLYEADLLISTEI
jgi:hypothetical protein